jgi:hypothetical protein
LARGTEGHGNLVEQKKINVQRLGYLYPQLGEKMPQLGVKIPRGKTKDDKKKFFLLFLLFFVSGYFDPQLAEKIPQLEVQIPRPGNVYFFCSTNFP